MEPEFTKTDFAEFYQQIGIEIGRTCNARCEHCITLSGPKNRAKMEWEMLNRIIVDASKLGLPHMELTGGEPFLFLEELKRILAVGQQHGLTTGITTNCYWAKDPAKACKLLEELQGLGLTRLRFSIDQYHLNYISVECLKNAVHAALEVGVHSLIEATVGRKDHKMYQAILELRKLPIEVRVSELMPFGKAVDLAPEAFLNHSFYSVCHVPCLSAGIPVVEHDGRVLLCCSYPVSQDRSDMESPFVLGDATQERLTSILTRHFHNPLLRRLRYEGPGGLLRALEERYGHDELAHRESYPGGICSLCADIMNHPKFRDLWHATVAETDSGYPLMSTVLPKARGRADGLVSIAPLSS